MVARDLCFVIVASLVSFVLLPLLTTFNSVVDFVAEAEDMISMKEGDTFVVVEEDHNGWTVVKKRNGTEEGFVPTEYIDNV